MVKLGDFETYLLFVWTLVSFANLFIGEIGGGSTLLLNWVGDL